MWTDADRFDALVWQTVDDDTCSGCGQPRTESMDPDNQGAYAAKRFVCFACEAKHRAEEQMTDRDALRYSYFATVKED